MKITQPKQPVSLALNAPASGVTIADPGGFFGGGPLTLEEFVALLGSGAYGPFLRNTLGGLDIVQALGTLGATELLDLANASIFWGTLDQNCTFTMTGWTNLRGAAIRVELIQDGTGGWTPTFSGVTWIGGTPTWVTTANTVTHVVLFSRDGGTTIYGAVVGGGATALDALTDVTITTPADADRLRYDGSEWVNSTLTWELMVDYTGLVMLDSAGNPSRHEVAY